MRRHIVDGRPPRPSPSRSPGNYMYRNNTKHQQGRAKPSRPRFLMIKIVPGNWNNCTQFIDRFVSRIKRDETSLSFCGFAGTWDEKLCFLVTPCRSMQGALLVSRCDVFFHFCFFWYFWMVHAILSTFQILFTLLPFTSHEAVGEARRDTMLPSILVSIKMSLV